MPLRQQVTTSEGEVDSIEKNTRLVSHLVE